MLTLFSIPKPFAGHIGVIQRNAIESWKRQSAQLATQAQIVLVGDEAGTRETALEFGLDWIPETSTSEFGTPVLSDAFRRVAGIARYPFLCYLNCDIILLGDLPTFLSHAPAAFLATATRRTIEQEEPVDFAQTNWHESISRKAESVPSDSRWSMDLFCFPTARFAELEMPPFIVGRPWWDNWLVFRASQLCWPIVDLTELVTLVHQRHDYGHVPGGSGSTWYGPEANSNLALFATLHQHFNLNHATHAWANSRLQPIDRLSVADKVRRQMALHPRWINFYRALFAPLLAYDYIVRPALHRRVRRAPKSASG